MTIVIPMRHCRIFPIIIIPWKYTRYRIFQAKKLKVLLIIFFLSNFIISFFNRFVFTVFKWPHEAILLLLEEYTLRQNDFVTGKTSQKKIWSLIADEMVKHGYKVTGAQCLSKFSGLKRTYKTVKDHNNKSGNGSRSWPYFSVRYSKNN